MSRKDGIGRMFQLIFGLLPETIGILRLTSVLRRMSSRVLLILEMLIATIFTHYLIGFHQLENLPVYNLSRTSLNL